MQNKLFLNKKILSAGLITLLFLGIVIFLSVINLNKNQFGNSVEIDNLDTKVLNIPKITKDSIKTSLYNTLKMNGLSDDSIKKITEVEIRKDTNLQSYDSNLKLYTGSFIVDIASIKQSYKAQYTYSVTSNSQLIGGTPISVSCLAKNLMIYPDFNCKDLFYEQTNYSDPILANLPKTTLTYEIKPVIDEKGKLVSLSIKLFVTNADYKTGVDQAVSSYKQEALAWISSLGLDPSKYTINYSY